MQVFFASSHRSEHHTSGNRGTSTQAQNARLRSVSFISSPWTDLNHCLQAHAGLAEQVSGRQPQVQAARLACSGSPFLAGGGTAHPVTCRQILCMTMPSWPVLCAACPSL